MIKHSVYLLTMLLANIWLPAIAADTDARALTLLKQELTKGGVIDLDKYNRLLKGKSKKQILRIFSKPDLIAIKGLDCQWLKTNQEHWLYSFGDGNLLLVSYLEDRCCAAHLHAPAAARTLENDIQNATTKLCLGKTLAQIKQLLGKSHALHLDKSGGDNGSIDETWSADWNSNLLQLSFIRGVCVDSKVLFVFQ